MFRPQRQHRHQIYTYNNAFLPFEALDLSAVKFSEAPYLRRMIRERREMKVAFDREADYNKWSQTRREMEWRNVVKFEYINNRWIRESQKISIGRPLYKASPWEMLHTYRKRAIERGEYFPPPKKSVARDSQGNIVKIYISKGDIEGQKSRRLARIKSSKGSPDYARYQRQKAEQKKRASERRRALEH